MIFRRIVAAVSLLCAFIVPAYAQKTKAALTTEINTNWGDNNTGAITPAVLRSTVLDIINSYFDLNGTTSLSCAAHQWIAALPTLSSITCTQPIIADISGWGTGVASALGVNIGTAGSFVVNGGALGTPSSGTLTHGTGLPVSTGISGMGTGVATALANAANASGGMIALVPVRAGDIVYWNGSAFVTLAGNNSGTQTLSENSSGVPSWTAAGAGTVTSAIIAQGTGITVGGTCTITTSGTCTVTNAGVLSVDAQVGAFTTGGGIASTSKVLQLALNNAIVQTGALANPTGTGATAAMMGLGLLGCTITPNHSGRIRFDIQGSMGNTTANNLTTVQLREGIGTAPSNGAAASAGSAVGGPQTSIDLPAGSGSQVPFHVGGYATGLTPGTAVWFDVSLQAAANTSSITNPSCSAMEID